MNEKNRQAANRQITELLIVVFSAVALAFIAIGGMIYSYGPTGSYLAKNVLLSPEAIRQTSFQDFNPNTKEKIKAVFDHVEFSYYVPSLKQFQKVDVEISAYDAFYQEVQNDRSLINPEDEMVALFSQTNPAKLLIAVRGKNAVLGTSSPFQQVDFTSEGDYYRVELHQESSTGKWVYYKHPGIYQTVMNLFVKYYE